MNNKLTYKIQNILLQNEYTEINIQNKVQNEEENIKNASIRFRYEPRNDKGYLSFGECKTSTICEVEDDNINEVILQDDSLIINTNETTYNFYKDKDKMYF